MMDNASDDSERRYQQLISASPAPINLFDASGSIIWGNDAVVDLLGLDSRDRLTGRSIFEFIHPDDRYTARQELAAVVEEKRETGPTSMQLRREDGEIRSIRVSTAPGRYRGKDIGQAVIIDVTESVELRAELASQRDFVETALDTLQDVFYVIDSSGDLVRWNDALLDVSGYGEAEVRRMDVEEFFVEEDRDRVSESIAVAFAEGEDHLEATVATKAGAEIPFEFRKRRLVLEGDIVGLVGIGRDVSARHERNQHIRAVDRLLQHNLRNQLNVIRGTTGILQESVGSQHHEELARIDAAVDRLLSLFDDHQHIVKLLTAQESLETMDVVPLVEAAKRQFDDEYPDATISLDVPETATVSAVPMFGKAIRELVENALEHNDTQRPTVDVVVGSTESSVTIRVVDDGPTIPEQEYVPMTSTGITSSTFHSDGLGLWFVHWIVSRSGGTLAFDRNDPRGNVVTMTIPTPPSRWSESTG